MPVRSDSAPNLPALVPRAQADAYELYNIPDSPIRRSPQRICHFHNNDNGSNPNEQVVYEDIDSGSDQDPASEAPLHFTHDEEQAVVSKFDRHLILFIAFLYMLGFLDRSSE